MHQKAYIGSSPDGSDLYGVTLEWQKRSWWSPLYGVTPEWRKCSWRMLKSLYQVLSLQLRPIRSHS